MNYRGLNNAVIKNTDQMGHEIKWEDTINLEKEERLYPRKILESCRIIKNREEYVNVTKGLCISNHYKKGRVEYLEGQGEEEVEWSEEEIHSQSQQCKP